MFAYNEAIKGWCLEQNHNHMLGLVKTAYILLKTTKNWLLAVVTIDYITFGYPIKPKVFHVEHFNCFVVNIAVIVING